MLYQYTTSKYNHIVTVLLEQLGSGAAFIHFENVQTTITIMVAVPTRPFKQVNKSIHQHLKGSLPL